MTFDDDLFVKYDLLIPSRFEGGYLILSLYNKIKSGQLAEVFTTHDIKIILEQISKEFDEPLPQTERLIKNLLHFILRTETSSYGKYYLTDHAVRLVELMSHKINNPYKNYPLKESFDKHFNVRLKDMQSINDLELRFGSEFVAGHKRIINDHMESLEDELTAAYGNLNQILQSNEKNATVLVKRFVTIFKTFGEKAEDISNAIAAKDRFMKTLRFQVDEFYNKVAKFKHPETEQEKEELNKYREDWRKAADILKDLDNFFQTVDIKINNIRRQILHASDKLGELHENFTSRSNFRLYIKRMLALALKQASYGKDGVKFNGNLPLKTIFQEETQLFYPEHYPFDLPHENVIVEIPRDLLYETEQRKEIEREIKSQEIINAWVVEGKSRLTKGDVDINEFMEEITSKGNDLMIALPVAMELTEYAGQEEGLNIEIKRDLQILNTSGMYLWKMNLQNRKLIMVS